MISPTTQTPEKRNSMASEQQSKKFVYRCSFYILPGKEEDALEECVEFWKENCWGNWRILHSLFKSGNQSFMDLEIEFDDFNDFWARYEKLMSDSKAKAFLDEYGRKFEIQRAGNEVFQIIVEGNK